MADSHKEASICLECGLCCNGTLFGRTVMERETENTLGQFGDSAIELIEVKAVHFRQPCPEYSDNSGCMIYKERPERCRKFRCKLLISQESGETSREKAIGAIVEMKKCREVLFDHLHGFGDESLKTGLSLNANFLAVHGGHFETKSGIADFCKNYKQVFVSYMSFTQLLKKFITPTNE